MNRSNLAVLINILKSSKWSFKMAIFALFRVFLIGLWFFNYMLSVCFWKTWLIFLWNYFNITFILYNNLLLWFFNGKYFYPLSIEWTFLSMNWTWWYYIKDSGGYSKVGIMIHVKIGYSRFIPINVGNIRLLYKFLHFKFPAI